MWHWNQGDYRAQNFARQLIMSVELMGIKVFPNSDSCWHFDDKVGQKYLLEAINAPLVPSYVFYEKKTAMDWIDKTSFPKVFKLRGGASSINVKLVKNKKHARKLINKAFKRGFPFTGRYDSLKDRFWRLKRNKDFKAVIHVLKGFIRLILPPEGSTLLPRQKGYVYFQDFLPNNKYDIRLIVIGGEKAYGLKRIVRKNDFRASGSKKFVYDQINNETIIKAFDIANKLKLQSVAFDFIYSNKGKPLIVEMSYGYGTEGSGKCKGYWDKDLNWHEGPFDPYGWMVQMLMLKK